MRAPLRKRHRHGAVSEVEDGRWRRLGFFTYLGGSRDAGALLAETLELFVAAAGPGLDLQTPVSRPA